MRPRIDTTISPGQIRAWFRYDPDSGVLYWRAGEGPKKHRADRAAGTPKKNGYINVRIGSHEVGVQRLIWVWMTGEWPDKFVDHRNQIRNDNRWSNLRLATVSQNGQNHRIPSDNKSGVCGVSFNTQTSKWRVFISVNGDNKYIGAFARFDDAVAARRAAELEFFGEFATAA